MSLLKLKTNTDLANQVGQQKATEIVRRIPSINEIKDVYLFGSAVNGVLTEDSDLDILVVVKSESDIKKIQNEVYSKKFADIAIDWIFKTEKEFDLRKDYGGVCFEAYHYGKKIL